MWEQTFLSTYRSGISGETGSGRPDGLSGLFDPLPADKEKQHVKRNIFLGGSL